MTKFQKVLVGLDLSDMDLILLQKISALTNALGIEKIYFVHVSKDLSIPESIKKSYPDLLAPVDESIKADIESTISKSKLDGAIEYEVLVIEGSPFESFLRQAKIKDVDLIVMGRKDELPGSGSLAKNMAQKAPCSVLFITEAGDQPALERILVPMDFSSHSVLCIKLAERFNEEVGSEIIGVHLFEIPIGYYKTGKSHSEFAEILSSNVQKDFETFIRKHDMKSFVCDAIVKDNGNDGKHILKIAKEKNASLILLGSRGRTNSAAILLGSTAEKLVQVNNEIPMLIFKKKGETMSFLAALSEI
ncbi:universal stress protein [Belliella kenyensis]|uniref:Universal stress protein n=1 Tax=Belliella kenyensis TaxID=1472724 RepID=A0ABV8EQC5_9BACT|nr:universal stress protein [Belliella kenyensis]MCH7401600.1 universal stress protein [Belliella kenyensis]MDN3603120.1 universal stress protein [Belliella kenyensis]